jgi:hypothetical protein
MSLKKTPRTPGSTRGSRVGDGVLAIANFLLKSSAAEITKPKQDFLSVLPVLRG